MTEIVTVAGGLLLGVAAGTLVLARRPVAVAGWGGAGLLPAPPAAAPEVAAAGFALVHRLTEAEEAMDWLEAHGRRALRMTDLGSDRFLVEWN